MSPVVWILQHPAHSPYLAPSDFHPSGALKRHFSGQRFVHDDVAAVMTWLKVLDHDFLTKCFDALVFHWDKCLNRSSDYVEKYFYDACMCESSCVSVVINVVPQSPHVPYFWDIPYDIKLMT
jgi:hypothetical protein